MSSSINSEIGDRLRLVRNSLKIPATKIAEGIGKNVATLYMMERGENGISTEVFTDLYSAFSVSPNYIILGLGEPVIQSAQDQARKELEGDIAMYDEAASVVSDGTPEYNFGKSLLLDELRRQIQHHREVNQYLMAQIKRLEAEKGAPNGH